MQNLLKYVENLNCFKGVTDPRVLFNLSNNFEHTMGSHIESYVNSKIHTSYSGIGYLQAEYKREEVLLSGNEKLNKLFNFERPTFNPNLNKYYIFPGFDYYLHYDLMYQYYRNYSLKTSPNLKIDVSRLSTPKFSLYDIWSSLRVPSSFPKTVILGYVEGIKDTEIDWSDWKDCNQFSYSLNKENSVMLLGCKHSYWGDISGVLVHKLASLGAKNILYVGKLGSLIPELKPNESIVTGSLSYLEGSIIDWKNSNLCENLHIPKVKHYSLPSTMLETKSWAIRARTEFDVVDPEIGHMALQSLRCGINFGYIHIVTDFLLGGEDLDGLHEEVSCKSKRLRLIAEINDLVKTLPIW